MPIVTITQVGAPGNPGPGELQGLADELATIYGCGAQQLWVNWKAATGEHYVENGGKVADPLFVAVLLADWPDEEKRANLATATASAVARALSCATEHVHVLFEPPGRGRIAFGGNLVT